MMKEFTIEALLGLYSVPSIGPTRMRKLISVFKTPQAVLDADIRRIMNVEGIDRKTAEKIKKGADENFIQNQLAMMKEHGVEILTYWDEKYPEQLKKIYDPPAFLFFKGDLECFQKPAVAIVGTRVPSSYGKMITEQFSRELVQHDFVIISGFARGIDTHAHKTALKNGGKTIAVLGNGLDQVYPPENKSMLPAIYENGAVISEYPMGTKPEAGNFPKRNRIISGLSDGILLTEAGAKSGALITAFYGLDQNREIFSVPGAITSGKSAGTNRLIKEGAKLVQSTMDILEELDGKLAFNLGKEKTVKKIPHLDEPAKTIYDLLGDEPLHIDQLAIQADLSTSETLSVLLTLELMDLIRQLAGKMFIKY
jgi:DNA processing protein